MLAVDGSTTSRRPVKIDRPIPSLGALSMGRGIPSHEMDLPSGTILAYWLVP